MKAPEKNNEATNDIEENEVTYTVNLLMEKRTIDEDGELEVEEEKLMDCEDLDLDQLKKLVRDKGINTPTTKAPMPGMTFFSSSMPDENRDYFEKGIESFHHLWIMEINGSRPTEAQLRETAEALGMSLQEQGPEERWRESIKERMARTLFLCAIADQSEALGYSGPAGGDWDDFAPETREVAGRAADGLIRVMEAVNHGARITQLFARARRENPDLTFEKALEDFAHYTAMQAQGHGVSWDDNHEPFDMDYPIYFSASDLILVGRDDLDQLPGFDFEALKIEAEDSAVVEALDATPEKTQWGFSEDYDPIANMIERYTPASEPSL